MDFITYNITYYYRQDSSASSEEFFLDGILQRHARRLLKQHNLSALGYFAAHLDFRLIEWLHRERELAARVDNFIAALKHLHVDFCWPYPILSQPLNNFLLRKMSCASSAGTFVHAFIWIVFFSYNVRIICAYNLWGFVFVN